jgi:hypothetical protein
LNRGEKLIQTLVTPLCIALLITCRPASAQQVEMGFYFGYLHSHTSFSDGALTPEDAYAHARDVAGLDFLGITEHGYYMVENPHHWEALVETAWRFTEPGRFVAFRGTEWTHGAGHISVIEAPEPCSRDTQRGLEDLVAWMEGKGAVATFNHPGWNEQGMWNDFQYSLAGNRTIRLLEVGSGPYARNTLYERSYIRALDRGWKVGATNSQDNHRADWGTAADTRTGVVARALTHESLMEALRALRTYSTEDRNVQVRFAGNGKWMGEILPLGKVELEIEVRDPDPGDVVEKVEVRSNGGVTVVAFDASGEEGDPGRPFRRTFEVEPTQGYTWYYARIQQSDGDLVVTSPIWAKSQSDLIAVDLRFDVPMAKKGTWGHLRCDVVNLGKDPLVGVIVEFSASAGGRRWPIGAMRIDLEPGATVPVSLQWSCPVSGDVTVMATLVDPARPGLSDNVYSARVKVLPENLREVVVDEGHNNRSSGFAGRFLEALSTADSVGRLSQGRICPEALRGASVLVVANPEPGISLTPSTFDESEIAAIRGFVALGGALILAGSSDASDPSRDVAQLNAILASLGSSMRFSDDEVWLCEGPTVSSSVTCELARAGEELLGALSLPVQASQACTVVDAAFGGLVGHSGPVVILEGSDGTKNVDTNGKGPWHAYETRPVVCAMERIGDGCVVAMGAPLYSVYDFRPGLGNEEFMLKLVRWLQSR